MTASSARKPDAASVARTVVLIERAISLRAVAKSAVRNADPLIAEAATAWVERFDYALAGARRGSRGKAETLVEVVDAFTWGAFEAAASVLAAGWPKDGSPNRDLVAAVSFVLGVEIEDLARSVRPPRIPTESHPYATRHAADGGAMKAARDAVVRLLPSGGSRNTLARHADPLLTTWLERELSDLRSLRRFAALGNIEPDDNVAIRGLRESMREQRADSGTAAQILASLEK